MTRGHADDYGLVVAGEDIIDRVEAGLFIGNMYSATRWDALRARRVTHILCMTRYRDRAVQCRPREFTYLGIEAADDPEYDIAQHFDEICAFVGQAIGGGGVVYVHCMHGITRAATAVVVFLMRAHGMAYIDALAVLRRARPIVELNDGFRRALKLEERVNSNNALIAHNHVFSQIIRREAPAHIVFENGELLVFENNNPASTIHLLVICKTLPVIHDVSVLTHADLPLLLRMHSETERFVRSQRRAMGEFLVGFHVPPFISVPHLHMHVILGEGRFADATERFNAHNFVPLGVVLRVLRASKRAFGRAWPPQSSEFVSA